jgi:hypothetical protein
MGDGQRRRGSAIVGGRPRHREMSPYAAEMPRQVEFLLVPGFSMLAVNFRSELTRGFHREVTQL